MVAYFGEDNKNNTKDHTSMYFTRQAVKNGSYLSDWFPKSQNDYATRSDSVKNLVISVMRLNHFNIEASEDGYSIDSEMRRGNEEARG